MMIELPIHATIVFDATVFNAALIRATRAFEDFARELSWSLYKINTCRSALSDALRPW